VKKYPPTVRPEDFVELMLKAPMGIVIYRPLMDDEGVADLECLYVNERSAELIGQAREQLIGVRASDLFGEDWPKMQAFHNTVVMSGEPCTYTRHHVYSDGREFDYQAVAWWDPPYIAIVARDVEGEVFPIADRDDLDAALRLTMHRTEQTLELARLLERQGSTVPKNKAEGVGLEPTRADDPPG